MKHQVHFGEKNGGEHFFHKGMVSTDFLCSPRTLGEDEPSWTQYFSMGLVQPPTSPEFSHRSCGALMVGWLKIWVEHLVGFASELAFLIQSQLRDGIFPSRSWGFFFPSKKSKLHPVGGFSNFQNSINCSQLFFFCGFGGGQTTCKR